MKGDLSGFATIGAFVALLAWLVPNSDVSVRTWAVAFVALGAGACFWWHHPKAPKHPNGWLKYFGQVLLVGCCLIPLHAVIYGIQRWQLVFDFSLLAFGFIAVAAGFARSIAKGEQNEA